MGIENENNDIEIPVQYKDLSDEVERRVRSMSLGDLIGLDETGVKAKEKESEQFGDELNKKIEASDLTPEEKDRLKKIVYWRTY